MLQRNSLRGITMLFNLYHNCHLENHRLHFRTRKQTIVKDSFLDNLQRNISFRDMQIIIGINILMYFLRIFQL